MFVLFVLCDLITFTTPVIYPIPSDYVRKTLLFSTQFDKPIRSLHPTLNLVTGQEFIAHINNEGEITKRRDFPVDTKTQSTCLLSHSNNTCSSYSTSIVQLSNNTLYYCISNSRDPKPRSGSVDLVNNNDWGLTKTCLYDPDRHSHTIMFGSDMLFGVSDSEKKDTGSFYSINTTSLVTKTPNSGYTGFNEAYKTLFKRKDFVYAIYSMTTSESQITRSCLADHSTSGYSTDDISTFTKATLQCKSESTIFTKVIKAEYDITQDLLFVLFSRDPREYSSDVLCAFNLTYVDNTFDTGLYQYYDKTGKLLTRSGTKVDCTKARTADPDKKMIECIDTISTSVVLLANLVNYDTMTLYSTRNTLLFYLTTGDQLHIWRYNGQTADLIQIVNLWGSKLSDYKIYKHPSDSAVSLYTFSIGSESFTGSPYWCGFYQEDPVTCLGTQHPDCSYSTAKYECISTSQCGTEDCFQSLDNGKFSAAFPEGLTFTKRGSICTGGLYNDTVYSYDSTGILNATKSTRKCDEINPVTASPTTNKNSWTNREIGLVIALIIVLVLLMGILIRFVANSPRFRRGSADAVVTEVIGMLDSIPSIEIDASSIQGDH